MSSVDEFENLVRGYGVVLGGLKACSQDICVRCLNLESAKLKTTKGLKKLEMDVEKSAIPEKEKKDISTKIIALLEVAEEIPLESETCCRDIGVNNRSGNRPWDKRRKTGFN